MAAITTNTSSANPGNTTGANYRGSFAIMTSLFFMWGFITSINDILVPRFKDAFALDNFQASLVQSAFFGAYFIGSLAYFCVSATKGDPIARIGYKNGVVIGSTFHHRIGIGDVANCSQSLCDNSWSGTNRIQPIKFGASI